MTTALETLTDDQLREAAGRYDLIALGLTAAARRRRAAEASAIFAEFNRRGYLMDGRTPDPARTVEP